MLTQLTNDSWVSTTANEHCVPHGAGCAGLGLRCGRWSTVICIRERDPELTLTYFYRTAQEAYDSHPIRVQAASDWIRKNCQAQEDPKTIEEWNKRVIGDLRKTIQFDLPEDL